MKSPSIFWSSAETDLLLNSVLKFGPDWYKIAKIIPTRTPTQLRQKFYYINSKLTVPATLYVPLEEVNFQEIFFLLQNS